VLFFLPPLGQSRVFRQQIFSSMKKHIFVFFPFFFFSSKTLVRSIRQGCFPRAGHCMRLERHSFAFLLEDRRFSRPDPPLNRQIRPFQHRSAQLSFPLLEWIRLFFWIPHSSKRLRFRGRSRFPPAFTVSLPACLPPFPLQGSTFLPNIGRVLFLQR